MLFQGRDGKIEMSHSKRDGCIHLGRVHRAAETHRMAVPAQHIAGERDGAGVVSRRGTALAGDHAVRLTGTVQNVTNHWNPLQVHSNTADPQYGQFFGNYDRKYQLDFDFLF
jgi:hypothetical protein